MTSPFIAPRMLLRTLGMEFYRENAGFFFLLLAFGIGILRPIEHLYLMQAAVSSPFFLAILLSLWGLYCLKATRYGLFQLQAPVYQWIHQIVMLPRTQQLLTWSLLVVTQYALATLYVGLILIQALRQQQWQTACFCGLFVVGVHILGIGFYMRETHRPGPTYTISSLTLKLNRRLAKPQYAWFWWSLFRQYGSTLAFTKLLSLAILLVTHQLYRVDTYDARPLFVAVLASGFLHQALIHYYHHFQQESLNFIRNLPLSYASLFGNHLITLFLVLVPESIVLIRYFGPETGWGAAGWAVAFLLSLLSLTFHSQLTGWHTMEKVVRRTFYYSLPYFLLIMYGASIIWLFAATLTVSYILLWKYHDRYEPLPPY